MTVRQAGAVLTIVILVVVIFMFFAAAKYGAQAMIIAPVVGLLGIARYSASRCPQCGKSAFVTYLFGEDGWLQRNVLWMERLWPELNCSRCGFDLSTS